MTKSELIERLSFANGTLNKREAELIVNTIFDSIGDALVEGGRVEIRGFGSFTIRERDAREATKSEKRRRGAGSRRKRPLFSRPARNCANGSMSATKVLPLQTKEGPIAVGPFPCAKSIRSGVPARPYPRPDLI